MSRSLWQRGGDCDSKVHVENMSACLDFLLWSAHQNPVLLAIWELNFLEPDPCYASSLSSSQTIVLTF